MSESQRAMHMKQIAPHVGVITAGPPCQGFIDNGEDPDIRRQVAEWRLKKEKTLFYFALGMVLVSASASVVVVTTGCAPGLIFGAGLLLMSLTAAWVRFLTGSTPPIVTLAVELSKLWSARAKGVLGLYS